MSKKIKIAINIIVIVLVFLSWHNVFAIDTYEGYPLPIDIDINGKFIKCNQSPISINGTTYIPLRSFTDAIGGVVEWNQNEMAATMYKNNHYFTAYVEKSYCVIDGEKKDYASIAYNGTTYVPVRVISETLGYEVVWDDFYLTVKVFAPDVVVTENVVDSEYTYEDILYLSKMTYTESGAEPFVVQLGIAGTIVNRVKSPMFPNTVKDVIFDRKYGVQFPPAHTDKINQTPSKRSIIAAKCVLNGVKVVGNSLYFTNAKTATSSWAHKNRAYYTTLGKVAFYE